MGERLLQRTILVLCFLLLNFFFYFFYNHAGIQEKPVNLQRNLHSNNTGCCEKLSNVVTDGPNVDQEDDTDEKLTEADSDTEIVENEPDENASEHDICQQSEENKPEELPGDGENDPKKAGGKRKLQIQGKWKGVDPVVFYKDETTITSIKTFYGLDDSFVLSGQLVTRNSDSKHVKRIYYISRSVKDVLELNLLVGQQLKITSVGLKMFVSIPILDILMPSFSICLTGHSLVLYFTFICFFGYTFGISEGWDHLICFYLWL